DAPTRAFCERRLVAEHLTARMPDWAMAALRASKSTSADHEAVLLRAMTFEGLGTDSLRIQALRDLATAFDAAPNDAPTSLLLELAKLAYGLDPARELSAHDALAKRGVDVSGAVGPNSKRGTKAVVEAARAAYSGSLEDTSDGLLAARAVSRAGDHEAARAFYVQLSEWSPNHADVWAELADEIAAVNARAPKGKDAAKVTSDEAAVLGALRRARELAPGEARYRAELALRTEGGKAEAREDEKYLVASEKVLARRQGVPPAGTPPDVADRELYWLRAVVMHPDKRVSQLLHYAREIVIAPRTQEELVEDLPAEGDLTEILRARVHRKDGGTAFPLEEHNEGTRPRIRWPELSPGDTVEVAVRNWTSHAVGGRGDPPFYFVDYAGATSTHPLLYNEVVVETLPQHPLYLDVLHGEAGRREEKDEKGKHITRLVWDKPISVAEEPLMPALSEVVPVILGSTFKSWAEFRTWYGEAIRGFIEPDAEVRRLAAELTKGKTTREQKLKALFDFVADDIRYVNYVSGEWWLPNRPQQLLARREGDCDDKAILLITLLRAVGIDAQEVMVQTRETGQPSILLAKSAAVPMFDHGIAFLPGPGPTGKPGEGMYLDATSPQSRLGPIPSMDARAVALRMDAGPAEIVRLPPSSPDDHGSDVTWNITLAADGSGDLAGEEKHIGDGAFWLRSYLTQADARTQYVEDNLVGGWFPTVQVDKKIEFNGELPNGAAWVKYKAHSDGLARHEMKELVVPLSPSQTLASSIAPLVKRTLPVSLPSFFAPSHQRRTIRVTAPAGYVWGDLPPGGDENGGEFGNAHLEVAKDPKDARVVVIKRTVVFDMSLIPVEKYAAWRAFIQRVDALMHKGVRAVPAAGGEK
ncbi:MAG: Transglutaminase-like enzyme putative cysteine protease, partial [Myxococcaceae bacterium]|nr:Transglutaminase-like enzyme putative cysteine protease [Myxococcaceae bacterium]